MQFYSQHRLPSSSFLLPKDASLTTRFFHFLLYMIQLTDVSFWYFYDISAISAYFLLWSISFIMVYASSMEFCIGYDSLPGAWLILAMIGVFALKCLKLGIKRILLFKLCVVLEMWWRIDIFHPFIYKLCIRKLCKISHKN